MDLVGAKIGMGDQGAQEGDVRGCAFEPERRQGPLGPLQRATEIGRVHDHLGEQRIEVGIGAIARIAIGVDAHARPRRRLERRERPAPRLGRAVGRHGLHVHPKLDRMAARRRLPNAGLVQRRTARQPQLRFHEVDAPHFLGDGVFDLKPRIGLDEAEEVRRRIVDQEFEGAEAAIVHRLRHLDGRVDDLPAHRLGEVGAGRQLDDLLAAALDRAFALAERGDAALSVAHDLNLDVARPGDQTLGIEGAVAEGRLRFGRGAREGLVDLAFLRDDPHATAAAARDRLDDDAGLAMLGKERLHARRVDRTVGARQHRRAVLAGMGASARLVTEQVELLRRGTDEDETRLGAGRREGSVLRQEPVARMHRVAARLPGSRNDTGDVEIGRCATPLERPDFVDPPHVQRGRVVLRMDTYGRNAEFGGGLGDANGDLAAIGDQEFLEHVCVG